MRYRCRLEMTGDAQVAGLDVFWWRNGVRNSVLVRRKTSEKSHLEVKLRDSVVGNPPKTSAYPTGLKSPGIIAYSIQYCSCVALQIETWNRDLCCSPVKAWQSLTEQRGPCDIPTARRARNKLDARPCGSGTGPRRHSVRCGCPERKAKALLLL